VKDVPFGLSGEPVEPSQPSGVTPFDKLKANGDEPT